MIQGKEMIQKVGKGYPLSRPFLSPMTSPPSPQEINERMTILTSKVKLIIRQTLVNEVETAILGLSVKGCRSFKANVTGDQSG